jgi:hypothetical protein
MPGRFFESPWRGIAPLTSGTMSRQEYEAWYDAHAWSPAPASGLTIESELDPAAWIEPRLHARRGMDIINDPHGTVTRYTLNLSSTPSGFTPDI